MLTALAAAPKMFNKTIALIDWYWTGHHPTYFCHYAEALAACGCEVYGLCPRPEEAVKLLGGAGLPGTGAAQIGYCPQWRRPRGSGRFRWRQVLAGAQNLLAMRKGLWALERKRGKAADLVFFNSIYDADFLGVRPLRLLLPRRWAGLYLQSFAFRETTSPLYAGVRAAARENRLLQDGRPVAVATLDEGIVGRIEAVTKRPNAVVFPDVTNEADPDLGEDALGGKIRALAAGRPVITLAGALYHQRGVRPFLEAAMAHQQWYFVLAGFLPPEVRKDCAPLLEAFDARGSTHGLLHADAVPDGAAFNGLVAASDVLWNLHLDWPGSSNTLTKAAVFERPVIVGSGHLLEERVRKFRLGEVCDENDSASISAALGTIAADREEWVRRNAPAWKEYRQLHSEERLKEAMGEVLALAGLGVPAPTSTARQHTE